MNAKCIKLPIGKYKESRRKNVENCHYFCNIIKVFCMFLKKIFLKYYDFT